MSKDQSFSIEYLGGIVGQRKEKTVYFRIGSDGLHIVFGFSNDKNYLIPWQAVVAISMTGSTNPAFQVVPKALYGFPGLQSVSSKTVKTGAKCFVSISYESIIARGAKAYVNNRDTLHFYALNKNQADVETIFARYMNLVNQNAKRYEDSLEEGKRRAEKMLADSAAELARKVEIKEKADALEAIRNSIYEMSVA